MKYKNMVQAIIEKVEGDKNIISVYHCATRLRFNLRDESKANTNDIKNIEYGNVIKWFKRFIISLVNFIRGRKLKRLEKS